MLDKNRLEILGKTIALATFLFTAGAYINDLWIEQKTARYNEIRSLIGRYQSDGIRDAEQNLSTRLLYYRVDGLDPNDPADYSDELFEEIAKETLFGPTGNAEGNGSVFLPRLLDIADFYAEVAFCIEESICDSNIGKRYFCPRAVSFTDSYARLIEYYDAYSGTEDWSYGLHALADWCAT